MSRCERAQQVRRAKNLCTYGSLVVNFLFDKFTASELPSTHQPTRASSVDTADAGSPTPGRSVFASAAGVSGFFFGFRPRGLPMRDSGVIDFKFEEVGLQIDGADVGMFSGTASIDKDGAVVGLNLDAYVTDRSAPLGMPKKVSRYIKVPLIAKPFCTFTELLARNLARAIQNGFEPEINEALLDHSVSRLEREWTPEAAE
jgi:hypothetical protein